MDTREDRRGPLDPLTAPGRWERTVASIVASAGDELERRARERTLLGNLLAWSRPALSAAATVAILLSASLALLSIGGGGEAVASEAPLASALVPEEVAAWLVAGYQPTVTEVVVAMEEAVR